MARLYCANFFRDSTNGGRATPFSVMIAVT
jgi:hypothetical protein